MMEKMPGTAVTATAFVRNFAEYSRAAGEQPVHILNHGRPAWSLVTTDFLAAVMQGGTGRHLNEDNALDRLIDSIRTHVLITDENLHIVRANPPARQSLGMTGEQIYHASLAEALKAYPLVLQAAQRVLYSGMPEAFDVDMVDYPLRTFHVRIEGFGKGIAVFSEETTSEVLARDRDAKVAAYEELIDTLPALARGSINGRGLITQATPQLADLARSTPERIVGTRLSTLFHSSMRTQVNEAVEELLTHGRKFAMEGLLQADGRGTVPVLLSAMPPLSHADDQRGLFLISRQGD